jgi:hypothetical protein
MQASALESKVRWWIAGFGAVGIIVALLTLFRFPEPPKVRQIPSVVVEHRKALVRMAKPDDSNMLLKEEAELRDMRPLFLPTERNAALPEPRLESGRTFLDNETLKLTFTDTEAQVSRDLPPVALLDGRRVEEARPIDALSLMENPLSLLSFGRGNSKVVPVGSRSAFLQVTALKDGTSVLDEKLPPNARPPGDKGWAPVEFIATVDAAGLVGPLVVTEGSRVEETDAHFRNYLARTFRIGDRLPPGFYRVTVSP